MDLQDLPGCEVDVVSEGGMRPRFRDRVLKEDNKLIGGRSMKSVVFEVNPTKSYIKSLGWPTVKPNVSLPLIVPLSGGKISLTLDVKRNIANGKGSVNFITDKFSKSLIYNISGGLQTITVFLQTMEIEFDPATGNMTKFGGYIFVMGQPAAGGAGSLATWYQGQSSLLDGNSASFDLSNGLGCGGGLVYEVGVGNPTDFIVHIEANVVAEDVDGDGNFESACPGTFWKSLHLDYEPPKIKIVFPFRRQQFVKGEVPSLPAEITQVIRFSDLWSLVQQAPLATVEKAEIDRVEVVDAQNLSLLLLDPLGNVLGGSVSSNRTKTIGIRRIDVKDLHVAVLPNRGVAVIRA